ncbi:citrate lyase subunit beta [Bacillus lacus]|uniref:Citrate lyase subunit beta n=1 Tax=Metabacillus lacus TaxID=1983721 RepID=A0A7X2IWT3_9BACI|nr:HpcH/HpaI aldolase/citrate lyase family protein [Metabacillus lacus]MRX71266.1 citrate lyase subunit beta [Metabacillus lacus]
MKYFNHLTEFQKEGIFFKKPSIITKTTSRDVLQYGLGAALYMPATRKDIGALVTSGKYPELCSMVICLEDAIGDNEVELAEAQVTIEIQSIYHHIKMGLMPPEDLPLIFLRVRTPEQIHGISSKLGEAVDCLTGFVFPKFSVHNAENYLGNLLTVEKEHNVKLYGMPIFESWDVIDKETRLPNLYHLKSILKQHKESILNIRIGATDLCGLYGIRRDNRTTIYDISIMRDFITDLINCFGKDFVISGPVWEYFNNSTTKLLGAEYHNSPLKEIHEEDETLKMRSQLLRDYGDGLIKETLLDQANGLVGKTVIHPNHLKIVQSLNVVSKEEYADALSIVESFTGNIGVIKSSYSNKMNEVKPHYLWAEKMLKKSEVYGVYHENHNFIDLLSESVHTTNLT